MRPAHLFVPALLACFMHPAPAGAEALLKVGGTGGALGTMRLLAEAYAGGVPGRRIEVLPSLGSAGGIRAVAEGAIDVGLTARPLREEEEALGLMAEEFARTPFVFITHRTCTVQNITTPQVIGFYSGAAKVCPCGERLRLVLRPGDDSDNRVLRSIGPGMRDAVGTALSRPGMLLAVDDQEAVSVVAAGPGRFGTTTLALVLSEERDVSVMSFNGIAPGVDSLRDGSYPLHKTFAAVTRRSPSPEIEGFISFLGSTEARMILEEHGNLPLMAEPATP